MLALTSPDRCSTSASDNGRIHLEGEIEGLVSLDLHALRVLWRKLLRGRPPEHLSRGLLLRILAYKTQARALGDLDRETACYLDRVAQEQARRRRREQGRRTKAPPPVPPVSVSRGLKEGTLLAREFGGPTTSKKGGARYRYDTSCVLGQGRREMAGSVPRVPAPEIDWLVLATLRKSETGLEAGLQTREEVNSGSPLDRVDRIVIRKGSVEIRHVQPQGSGPQSPIVVPWALVPSRRKRSITVPVGPGIDARPIRAETRARLVEGIAKARRWLDELWRDG